MDRVLSPHSPPAGIIYSTKIKLMRSAHEGGIYMKEEAEVVQQLNE